MLLISIIAIAVLTTVFALSSFSIYSTNAAYDDSKKIVSIRGNDGRKTTTINTPYGIYQTTGDILHPTNQVVGEIR